MKSNINHTPLRSFQSIKSYWRSGNIYGFKTPNYPKLDTEIHYQDGWRDYVPATIGENQRRGEMYHHLDNDIVTDRVIDLTEEEIKANRMSGAMVISQLQGLLMLEQMGLSDIVKESLEQHEHKASQIYFEYSPTWERESPIIGRMANLLGMTDDQLDDFFLGASQLS